MRSSIASRKQVLLICVSALRLSSVVSARGLLRDGKALDSFGPGRHTIVTANIPKLIDLIGKVFNDRTPFTAEIYFVSMKEFADRKWGTRSRSLSVIPA